MGSDVREMKDRDGFPYRVIWDEGRGFIYTKAILSAGEEKAFLNAREMRLVREKEEWERTHLHSVPVAAA